MASRGWGAPTVIRACPVETGPVCSDTNTWRLLPPLFPPRPLPQGSWVPSKGEPVAGGPLATRPPPETPEENRIDSDESIGCGTCLKLCPEIFACNDDTNSAWVIQTQDCDEGCIDPAVASCPVRCITNG